ncbi:MAG: hypothetical protein JST21_17905 [Bacteroidetes bacterium]|nr:hypothetical protein [Bacteroidota bacterium]
MNKIYLYNFFRPLAIVFIIINGCCFWLGRWLDAKGIDHSVLIVANLILFVLTLLTSRIHVNSLQNENPHVFVRGVTLSSFIKLMVIAISAFAYFIFMRDKISVYAVIVSMFFYIVYTVIEVRNAMRINSQRNAKN